MAKTNGKNWKVGWGVTNLCNMDCAFCYSKAARTCEQELPFERLKAFIDRNHLFVESINYGTGENTLSKTWSYLLEYIYKRYDIEQALTTNGTLAPLIAKDANGKAILKALDEVDVSLDFCESGKHIKLRGHEKAYDWAIDTIKLCQDHNIKTTIVILGVDQTLTFKNLDGIFNLASKYNTFVRINIFRPNIKQKLKPLTYQTLKKVLKYIVKNFSVVSLSDSLLSALLLKKANPDPTGVTSLRILPDGSITPSTYLVTSEWKAMSIREAFLGVQSFSRTLLKNIQPDSNHIPACQSCDIQSLCQGGTFDRRLIWFGGLHERDPYCPTRHRESIEEWQVPDRIKFVDGPKIHDGYLPTLIFSP